MGEEYMEDHRGNIDLELLQEEITAQICLRILERSCNTNEAIDRMCLEDEDGDGELLPESGGKMMTKRRRKQRNAERDLTRIKVKLDRDIEELLGTNKHLINNVGLGVWDILSQMTIPTLSSQANVRALDLRGGAYDSS